MVRALPIEPMTNTRGLEEIGGKSTSIYHVYWTNFMRLFPKEFVVIPAKDIPAESLHANFENEVWWQFKTNIEPAAFNYEWDEKRQQRFLYLMDDIYNRRKVRA
jgi:hypothetical protein